jgi:hypothetical protein
MKVEQYPMRFEADVASIKSTASGIGRAIVFRFARESSRLIYPGPHLASHPSSVKLPRIPQISTLNTCEAHCCPVWAIQEMSGHMYWFPQAKYISYRANAGGGGLYPATFEKQITTRGGYSSFSLPSQSFLGAPKGINPRRVVNMGTTPANNPDTVHHRAGLRMLNVGVMREILEAFSLALQSLHSSWKGQEVVYG